MIAYFAFRILPHEVGSPDCYTNEANTSIIRPIYSRYMYRVDWPYNQIIFEIEYTKGATKNCICSVTAHAMTWESCD